MSPKNRKSEHRASVAHKQFNNFIAYICDRVIDAHGKSYMNVENTRNKWRDQLGYKPEIEKFLISESKLYIRTLDSRNPNSTNPQFLKSLVNLMADYLSGYTHRINEKTTRNHARRKLIEALWDKNSYIQGMLLYQEQKRIERKENPTKTFANKHKQERIAQAKENYKIHRQVNMIFIEVNQYRKK